MTEKDISNICIALLAERGVTTTWYYNVPAFVLAGERSTISISGRVYTPEDKNGLRLGDVYSVDLSPSMDGHWGDCARTFCLGPPTSEIVKGFQMEATLHELLIEIAKPNTTFAELYEFMNELIEQRGFVNLDFAGNLGHSIEIDKKDRVYIERGNELRLSDVTMFTFEPHIRHETSLLGFKHEEIYSFTASGRLAQI